MGKQPRILIVDDNPGMHWNHALNKAGYELVTHKPEPSNPMDKIIKAVKHENPDLIVVDYNLGITGLNGIDVIKEIKKHDQNGSKQKRTPIILRTGDPIGMGADIEAQSYLNGANIYQSDKDSNINNLVAPITRLLSERQNGRTYSRYRRLFYEFSPEDPVMKIGNSRVDFNALELTTTNAKRIMKDKNGKEIELKPTGKSIIILKYLLFRSTLGNEFLSFDEILQDALDTFDPDFVRNHISLLRHAIESPEDIEAESFKIIVLGTGIWNETPCTGYALRLPS